MDREQDLNNDVLFERSELVSGDGPEPQKEVRGDRARPLHRSVVESEFRYGDVPQKRFRLKVPEFCWAAGCEKPAYIMTYLSKSYGQMGTGYEVDKDCPFLCEEHFLEDAAQNKSGRRPYTNRRGWGQTTYRGLLPPYKSPR